LIPDRQGQVRVRASFAGSVEYRVRVGESVWAGRALLVVEGDRAVETLSARNAGVIRELCVPEGTEVEKGALLLVMDETAPVS
jgi:pyruvate/2-oxoglutarate dehydrogenase complex dihydrolipoamide acyltransferase (E2) component